MTKIIKKRSIWKQDKIFRLWRRRRRRRGGQEYEKEEEEEEDNGKSVYISLKHSSENVFLDNLPYLQSKRSKKCKTFLFYYFNDDFEISYRK